jgi:hypothetical protein
MMGSIGLGYRSSPEFSVDGADVLVWQNDQQPRRISLDKEYLPDIVNHRVLLDCRGL